MTIERFSDSELFEINKWLESIKKRGEAQEKQIQEQIQAKKYWENVEEMYRDIDRILSTNSVWNV